MTDPRRRLIYADEAALVAHVERATIRDWVRRHELTPRATGRNGAHLFLEADVLLAEQRNRARRTR
jgi:hypothetical protein